MRRIRRIVFEDTGEHRKPRAGEWFLYDGNLNKCFNPDRHVDDPCIILRVKTNDFGMPADL